MMPKPMNMIRPATPYSRRRRRRAFLFGPFAGPAPGPPPPGAPGPPGGPSGPSGPSGPNGMPSGETRVGATVARPTVARPVTGADVPAATGAPAGTDARPEIVDVAGDSTNGSNRSSSGVVIRARPAGARPPGLGRDGAG